MSERNEGVSVSQDTERSQDVVGRHYKPYRGSLTIDQRLAEHEPSLTRMFSDRADALTTIDSLRQEVERLTEQLHYANGTCDLAIKHRDEAESRASRLEGACAKARSFIEYSLEAHGNDIAGNGLAALNAIDAVLSHTLPDKAETPEQAIEAMNKCDYWNGRKSLAPDTARVADREAIEQIKREVDSIAPAVEALACNQEQADADGVMVRVSRQAVDEVCNSLNCLATILSLLDSATPDGDPVEAQEAVIRNNGGST